MYRFVTLSLLAAFVLCSGAIGTVRADTAAQHFNIKIWNPLTYDYPISGTIDLTFNSDGAINGFYHPADLTRFIPVSGSRQGDHIWLTIGNGGDWQLNGNFKDGAFSGSATRGNLSERVATGPGPRTPLYSFAATPAK